MRLLLLISCFALSALLVSAAQDKSESSSQPKQKPTKLSAVRSSFSSSTPQISKRQDKRNLYQLGYGLPQQQHEPHQVYGPPQQVYGPPSPQIPAPSEPEAAHRPPAPVFERPEPIPLPAQSHPVSVGSYGTVVFPQHLVPVAPGPFPPAFPVSHPVPVAPALPALPIAAPLPVPAPLPPPVPVPAPAAPIYIPVIQTVTKHVPVAVHVPKPYPVHVDRIVHVNRPYPVHVAVPVHVPKPYPVPVAIRTHYESLHRDW